MTPTRPGTLAALVLGFGVAAYLLAAVAYGSLPVLPRYAPVSIVLLAVVELGMAKVVRDRLNHRLDERGRALIRPPYPRPLHPMQVARAAVLAKASSAGGAVAAGVYGGLLVWTLPRRAVAASEQDAAVAGLSVVACVGLIAAALVLERACRRPDDDATDSLESES